MKKVKGKRGVYIKKHTEEEMLLRIVESIIARSSVNLYFMTAFHPSSKQQVDEQTAKISQPPSSPYSCRSCGTDDLKSSFFFFNKFPVLPSGLLQSPGVGPTGPFQYLERLHLKAQSTTIRGHEEDIGNLDFCQISGCLQSNS